MFSIVIIGSGNAATCFGKALLKNGIAVHTVWSRDLAHAQTLASALHANAITELQKVPLDADLYIIAVSDHAIAAVSASLPPVKGLVVHVSGITPIDILSAHQRAGVFYPLQTFTKSTQPDFSTIPLLLEAKEQRDLDQLKTLALRLSNHVHEVSTEQRQYIHLAAVFANNFSNYLAGVASEILAKNNLPFDLLRPLILETASKLQTGEPKDMQTGPARRDDQITIEKHLALLEEYPQYKALYEILSAQIAALYKP